MLWNNHSISLPCELKTTYIFHELHKWYEMNAFMWFILGKHQLYTPPVLIFKSEFIWICILVDVFVLVIIPEAVIEFCKGIVLKLLKIRLIAFGTNDRYLPLHIKWSVFRLWAVHHRVWSDLALSGVRLNQEQHEEQQLTKMVEGPCGIPAPHSSPISSLSVLRAVPNQPMAWNRLDLIRRMTHHFWF